MITVKGSTRPITETVRGSFTCTRCGIQLKFKGNPKPVLCQDCREVEDILNRGGYSDCGRTAINGAGQHYRAGEPVCDGCRDRRSEYRLRRAAA